MIGSDEDLMRDVYMTKAQREAYDRLRKDAERYRWLREEAFQATAARIVQMLPGHMDAEIDAAMKGANV